MTTEIVPHDQIELGDVLRSQGLNVTVLRPGVEAVETVWPLAGRPCWRYWCRAEDGREGFMSYGIGGVAVRVIA